KPPPPTAGRGAPRAPPRPGEAGLGSPPRAPAGGVAGGGGGGGGGAGGGGVQVCRGPLLGLGGRRRRGHRVTPWSRRTSLSELLSCRWPSSSCLMRSTHGRPNACPPGTARSPVARQ